MGKKSFKKSSEKAFTRRLRNPNLVVDLSLSDSKVTLKASSESADVKKTDKISKEVLHG